MIKKAFFIAFVFILFAGCSNKLSLLAPYKEMVSVYGLLDQDDTTHYIRIERVFEGEGNAYTFAQNPDSAYFQHGDLTVKLERWRNGYQISVEKPFTSNKEIILTDTVIQNSGGIFSPNERVFKTNHKLYADDSTAVYKLVIHNNKTGKDFTAQTGLIGSFQLISPTAPLNYLQANYQSTFKMNIVPTQGGEVRCLYNSPANSGVCSLNIQLVYTENTGGGAKIADISLGTLYPAVASPTLGGSTEDFTYLGTSLLSDIAATIPVNTSVMRTLNYVQFVLSAGGVDVALYNQVNSSTSLSQSKANYSNINGGVGIFSSRHKIKLIRNVNDICLDTLSANSQTCKLRFLSHLNTLSPCH
ncbi:MAG: hypothetical protein ABI448_09595 [Bacteroidia bacterium]